MSSITSARSFLQDSLTKRVPTWAVAEAILNLNVVPKGTPLLENLKNLAGEARWSNQIFDDFDKVDPADTQLVTLHELFPNLTFPTVPGNVYDADYTQTLHESLQLALESLNLGDMSANEALRTKHNLNWSASNQTSKKAFLKRVRFLNTFEEKITRVEDVIQLRHAQMQAKSRLAYAINTTGVDDATLAYVAYIAARANRRSLFMLGGQSKAFDNISEGLKKLLDDNSNWFAVAHVTPTTKVFSHLTEGELGSLVGVFHREMVTAANQLAKLWPSLPTRMRDEMVMVQGVDSSRWNAYAGALNTMRSAWISATIAAGLGDRVFATYLPGKAPRLMAADLVWWARSTGEDLHEDTRLFATLPHPWDVISGKETLTRDLILDQAAKLGITTAEATGWVGPRSKVETEVAEAEPATVHGVIVADPDLAATLRKHGVFSSKTLKNTENVPDFVKLKENKNGKETVVVI